MNDNKFRAWDKEENIMHDVECVYMEPSGSGKDITVKSKDEEGVLEWLSFDDAELMQYTGLKDVNGVEIYEGDVVEYTDHWSGQSYINEIYWKFGSLVFDVEYEEEKSYTVPIHSIHMDDDRGYEQTLKVLGNIYEHPEILGDSQ